MNCKGPFRPFDIIHENINIYYNMNICRLAIFVLLISFLGILFDIYIFGFNVFEFLKNILYTIIIVFITNWSCHSLSYNWIAWFIVFINILLLFSIIFLMKTKNKEIVKQIIEEEKQKRNNNKK
jgi:hypothetical protein